MNEDVKISGIHNFSWTPSRSTSEKFIRKHKTHHLHCLLFMGKRELHFYFTLLSPRLVVNKRWPMLEYTFFSLSVLLVLEKQKPEKNMEQTRREIKKNRPQVEVLWKWLWTWNGEWVPFAHWSISVVKRTRIPYQFDVFYDECKIIPNLKYSVNSPNGTGVYFMVYLTLDGFSGTRMGWIVAVGTLSRQHLVFIHCLLYNWYLVLLHIHSLFFFSPLDDDDALIFFIYTQTHWGLCFFFLSLLFGWCTFFFLVRILNFEKHKRCTCVTTYCVCRNERWCNRRTHSEV